MWRVDGGHTVPAGRPARFLSLPDWPLARPWGCWETLGLMTPMTPLFPSRGHWPLGAPRALGLGVGPVRPPAPNRGTDALHAPSLVCQPHLRPAEPGPSLAGSVSIALTISTLFVSSDSCCTHLCCPAVSPPVDCACGELPLRAFTNCPSAPGASIHVLHMAPSSTAASTVTTACVAPFCLSPHPDCPPSPRAPVGPCKCPSRTGWWGRTLWERAAGCPPCSRLREPRPSRAGWGEAGRPGPSGSAPSLLRRLSHQAGAAGAGREVAVCGPRWWPVQTGSLWPASRVGPQPHSFVPAPFSPSLVSLMPAPKRQATERPYYLHQPRLHPESHRPSPGLSANRAAACAPSVPCPGTPGGTVRPPHSPDHTLWHRPRCGPPVVRTWPRHTQQHLAEN